MPGLSARQPGVRICSEFGDVARQSAAHHVLEGDVLENVSQARAHRHPDILKALGGAFIDGRLGSESSHLSEWTVERTHHVGEGDRVGGSGEPVTALGSPLTRYDSRSTKVVQDAAQKFGGEVLRRGQRVRGRGLTVRGRQGE